MKKFTFFLITLCSIQIFSQINMTKDPSFGNDGGFITSFNTNQIVLNSHLIVLKDQSILYLINTTDNDYIFKLKPNGTLDSNFANNGKLEFEVNNFFNAVQQGDKILVYFGPKNAANNPFEDSKILRYHQNGTLDATFGDNGVLNEITESTNPQSLSVLVLADQSLMVTNSNSSNAKKFTIDGQLDPSFGNNGEINYPYHFPLGQADNGKIATCDINSLSSSIFSFYDLHSLETNTILNLNHHSCHYLNGLPLQNKNNRSSKMTHSGLVYSVFEYNNYPLPDFSRLIVMKDEHIDSNFNENGFVTSADYEQFLDVGFSEQQFFVLNQKDQQKSLIAYSSTGTSLKINGNRDFALQSGQEIEVKPTYILVNSIIQDENNILNRVKIEKFLFQNNNLSTSNNQLKNVEIQNPVKDILNIKNGELAENFEIYSTDGRKILQSKNIKNINITPLPKGIYILKIRLKTGETVSKKLMKN